MDQNVIYSDFDADDEDETQPLGATPGPELPGTTPLTYRYFPSIL